MQKLTVALVQHRAATPDQARNTEAGLAFVREAKRRGADLVLFPECWITSYGCPEELRRLPPPERLEKMPACAAWYDAALTPESEPILRFREAARELSVGIVITGLTKGGRRPQNTAFLIGRDGEILLTYHKVHTCDFDWEQYLESGEEFPVCRFDGVCVGLMICYDREYPESARELALQGAELILVPNDCEGMEPRLLELKVRAMENMTGIAMANPPGTGAGRSCAYGPAVWNRDGMPVDSTLLEAGENEDGVLTVTFDIDALRDHRRREDLGKYRKVRAYRHLTEKL